MVPPRYMDNQPGAMERTRRSGMLIWLTAFTFSVSLAAAYAADGTQQGILAPQPTTVSSNPANCLGLDIGLALLLLALIGAGRIMSARRGRALRDVEAERERLFTLSLDMFCVAGFDGHFKLLNPAWEKSLGFPMEEMLAQPYLSFVHPEDQQKTIDVAQEIAAGTSVVSFENRYRCSDGTYRWLLWNAVPSPERRLIYAVARDITKQQQAAELEQDLNAARVIQESLFPDNALRKDGLDLAGRSVAIRKVGGDYFDYFPLLNNGTGVVVGDVSGHGLAASLLAVQARAYLRALSLRHGDVGELLTTLNELIAAGMKDFRFMTMILAHFNLSLGSMAYASAGHECYLLRDGKIILLQGSGTPLGISEDCYITEAEVTLMAGDIFLFLTDGLKEAWSPDSEHQFGMKRIIDLVQSRGDQTALEIVQALFRAVQDFSLGNPDNDDMTALVVKVGGQSTTWENRS